MRVKQIWNKNKCASFLQISFGGGVGGVGHMWGAFFRGHVPSMRPLSTPLLLRFRIVLRDLGHPIEKQTLSLVSFQLVTNLVTVISNLRVHSCTWIYLQDFAVIAQLNWQVDILYILVCSWYGSQLAYIVFTLLFISSSLKEDRMLEKTDQKSACKTVWSYFAFFRSRFLSRLVLDPLIGLLWIKAIHLKEMESQLNIEITKLTSKT